MHKKEYKYRIQHACFDCRKVFKIEYRSAEEARRAWLSLRLSGKSPDEVFVEPDHVCPECSKPIHMMGRTFQAPKRDNLDGWAAAALLYHAGFRYHSGLGYRPTTAREAREFIVAKRSSSDGEKLARRIQHQRHSAG